MSVYWWRQFRRRWIWSRPLCQWPLPPDGPTSHTIIKCLCIYENNSGGDGEGYGVDPPPKSGVLSGRLIKLLPWQVVQFLLYTYVTESTVSLCHIRDSHWALTWTGFLSSPVYLCSWEWCLVRKIHQALTWTSCLTSPESGGSSGRLIEQLPRQVVQLCTRVVAHQGESSSSYPDKLSIFHWGVLSGRYPDRLPGFPYSCSQEWCLIRETH